MSYFQIGGRGGGISGPIIATQVTETATRRFITPEKDAQISANTQEIASHSQRIIELENKPVSSTDEMVKMDAASTAKYLSELIDSGTLSVVDGKLIVTSLNGLLATISELNSLQGVTGSIQEQLNALSSITNVDSVVDTELDLPGVGPTSSTILVRSDSTQGGSSTFYVSNGTAWEYVSRINSSLARDFTTDPIKLITETTGILPKSRYEQQNAAETPFVDASGNIAATNTQDAIRELFTLADNGRKSVTTAYGYPLSATSTHVDIKNQLLADKFTLANNLVAKGVSASSANTIQELIQKVSVIPNVSIAGTMNRLSKLNITAPYTLDIVLNNALSPKDICTTLLEFIQDTGVVQYDVDFDNTDATDFQLNNYVQFDGTMKLATMFELTLQKDETWQYDGTLQYVEIDTNDYASVNGIDFQ